jgi:hypothetical protein
MTISGGVVGIVIVLIVFGSIAAIILVPAFLRERTKQSAHHLIAQAIEKGQPLDPALLSQLTENARKNDVGSRPRRTLGNGIVLLALAAGFLAADYFRHGELGDATFPAMIMGALGAAFTLLAIVDYLSKKKSDS